MTTTATIRTKESRSENQKIGWLSLYRLGGMTALLAILVTLTDISLTFLPAGAEPPGTMTAIDWFVLFQDNWFMGLRNLGLLPNILSLILVIPLFLALYEVHRLTDGAYAALALILALVGTAIYLSNNAAFPMWALSAKYSAATTEAQRTLIAAAGEAVLARGEDFTPGALMGFLFAEAATVSISCVMLRGGIFSKGTAYAGILGGLCLAVFTVWATFIPVLFEVAMLLALIGGIASITWNILTARKLFELSTSK
jgi:membrane-bound ClpP family serine protease